MSSATLTALRTPRSVPALQRPEPQVALWAPLLFILSLGLVVVYSSSSAYAAQRFGDAEHFLAQQLAHAAAGFVALLVLTRVPTRWLQLNAAWIFAGAVLLCALVLIPGLGVFRGGARRWLAFGALGFQPSEVAKLAVVIALAAILTRREARAPKDRPSLLVPVLVAQLPVVLILAEPDLGTALVIELLLAAMVFVAGVRLRTLLVLALAALPVFYHLLFSTPFRLRRLLAYLDPWAYRTSVGYQITEAQISMGSGGLGGLGLGEGKHSLFYLPAAHTDFIFAIIGQELGFLGVLALLLAYALLLAAIVRIAWSAAGSFERYLTMGVAALIGIPALFNACVVTGLLPTKGLPLPLVSYGGSNLVITLAAIGLVLRVARQRSVEATR